MTIDVLTVKGAGHMVPTDRPGPSAQMITNFMFNGPSSDIDYSYPIINSDPTLAAMLPTQSVRSMFFLSTLLVLLF